jgi:hypothetical protein
MKVFRLAIVDRLVLCDTVYVTQRANVKPVDFDSLPYTSAYRKFEYRTFYSRRVSFCIEEPRRGDFARI